MLTFSDVFAVLVNVIFFLDVDGPEEGTDPGDEIVILVLEELDI